MPEQKPLNELGKTSAKENRHRRRRANLCGKRWSTSARGNMARVPPTKPSPLDCPRHDEPELNFRRRKEGRPGRRNRQRAIHGKQGRGASHRGRVRARPEKRSNANRAGPHRIERYRVRRVPPRGGVRKRVIPELQKKPRALPSETVNRASYFSLITRSTFSALPRSRTDRPWFEYRPDQKSPAPFSDAPASVWQNRSSQTSC